MADLTGRELVADEQFAADDDASANTAADPNEQQVFCRRLECAVFGEHCCICIVGHVARHVDRSSELGGKRFVCPLHVGSSQDDTMVVDDARCRATDAQQRVRSRRRR